MKNNKVFKTAASLLAVVILITAVFFFLQKSNTKTEVNNKANIDTKQAAKNTEKVEERKSEAVTDKSAETKAGSDSKEIESKKAEEAVKAISKEQGITVFVKSANFGLTAELLVDRSKFNKNYKFYQYSLEGKAISNIESTTKLETTIFPTQEFGSKANLILFDENKKVQKTIDVILSEKK